MRHLLRNSILVVGILVLMASAVFPPSEKIRLGKDLRGGVTLVYAVQIDRSEDASDVLNQTISVLKERVDPSGLFEIRMVAQGDDRIEVTMPLPSERAKQLRAEFDAQLETLRQQAIEPGEFERIMRLPDAERAPRIEAMAAGSEERLETLRRAAAALDDARRARAAVEAAELGNQPAETIDALVDQVVDAEVEYESLRDEVLTSALAPEDLRRALELPDRQRIILDDEGKGVPVPSPKRRALEEILAAHPDQAERINAIVAAYETYLSQRTSLDDTSDLKRLLGGAGVLTFRIAVSPEAVAGDNTHPEERRLRQELQEKGPRNVRARDARWFKINDPFNALNLNSVALVDAFYEAPALVGLDRGYVVEEYQGEYFMLLWDVTGMRLTPAEGRWSVASSYPTTDESGRPAIGFEMDAPGARLFGELTGANVQRQMAVLLDDEVYTAPNLNSRISRQGIIQGEFTPDEISYIVRTLSAGSLQARLSPEPISESTVAPDLGKDNLDAGLAAGMIALVTVGAFMVLYYFGFGMVAVVCLLANALCLLGCMALARAAFSLPGIAGVILTFGMAVDANVLIFERTREELRAGKDLRVALKLGYEKAMSSIVDGNVTNLIVCFVLAYTGTQEIKGFAITLGIGVVTTMFSALVISRLLFTVLTDKVRVRKMTMLPMVVQPLERALHPNINWISLRYVFIAISTVYVGLGIGMIAWQGSEMLDTEFRGGVQVTMPLREAGPGEPAGPRGRLTSTRAEVESRIRAIGEGLDAGDPLAPLRSASILPINPADDGITSDTFQIKTYATDPDAVLAAVISALGEMADARPALEFRASGEPEAESAPARAVLSSVLGENVGRPDLRESVADFRGGLAILLEDIRPQPTLENLRARLDLLRGKPDFSGTLGRRVEVRVLEGTPSAVRTAVVLVLDEGLSVFDNEEAWNADVRDREWRLLREALTQPTTLASVQSFSPVVADDFKAQAVVAVGLSFLLITIYIWVRFGSVRFSMAALATLAHDVLTAIGLIALCEIVYESQTLSQYAAAIGIAPFKIDLNMVAAMLTIVGYSLNDTIIILDRIRENRGKLPYASKEMVNRAINQTISRTAITSGTTLLAVLILYIFGGQGVRAFSFALLVGVGVGTYSSIAVAAPLAWSGKSEKQHRARPVSGA